MFGFISIQRPSVLRKALIISVCSYMCGTPLVIYAQKLTPNTASLGQVYEPDFFNIFQPQTAQDMVSRIPGFTLEGRGNGGRGFGQANLNILINGQRPSSKSADAREILGRIATKSVVRIEILNGASLDIPGLTGQVANIITKTDEITGNWEYAARFEEGTEPQLLEGKISLSGSAGNLNYVASFESNHFSFSENGQEQFFTTNGTQFEDREERLSFEQVNPSLGLNLTWTPQSNHIVNLNLDYNGFLNSNFDVTEILTPRTLEGRSGQTIFTSGENEVNYEIGGDYSFPIANGTLKFIGLHRYENSHFVDRYHEFIDPQNPYISQFTRKALEGEYIARSEYNWKQGTKQDWQISLEGAFNLLDDTSGFEDNTNVFTPHNVRVEERRAEGFLTHSWALTDTFNLQSALGVEYSRLEVPTSNDPAREFMRPKGSLAASYILSPKYTIRSKIERSVGQLNFFDFVSSISLTENTSNGGNTEIVPTQFWNGEIELERKDDKTLSGSLKAAIRLIEDPIDRIPLGNGGEGPGNLERALELSSHINGTWLMDHIGLKGMRLEFEGDIYKTEIDDPVTGLTRAFNGKTLWHMNGSLTHDIPNTLYAWTFYVEKNKESKFFRLDQSFDTQFVRPFTALSLTHKNLLGMKVSVKLQNLFNIKKERTRQYFDVDRNGAQLGHEFRRRQRGRRIGITFENTF